MTRSAPKLALNFVNVAGAFFFRDARAPDLSGPRKGAHLGLCCVLLPYGNIPAQGPAHPNGCSNSFLKNSSSSTSGILCL